MVLLYIIIYLIGSVVAYGIATWMQYKSQLGITRFIRPDYVKSYHNPIAIMGALFSWVAAVVFAIVAKDFYGKVRIRYNFKPLWDNWNKTN